MACLTVGSYEISTKRSGNPSLLLQHNISVRHHAFATRSSAGALRAGGVAGGMAQCPNIRMARHRHESMPRRRRDEDYTLR